jgi:hypothetical protein
MSNNPTSLSPFPAVLGVATLSRQRLCSRMTLDIRIRNDMTDIVRQGRGAVCARALEPTWGPYRRYAYVKSELFMPLFRCLGSMTPVWELLCSGDS